MASKTQPTDEVFFQAVAELGKLLGLSKSASLTLAVLFTADEPLSLDDVAERMSIAKSSISVILKNLEQMGLTVVVDKLNDRRKFYRLVDNPGDAFAGLIARKLDNLTSSQALFLSLTAAEGEIEQERLEELQAIYHSLGQLATFLHMRGAAAWVDIPNCLPNSPPPH